MFLQKDLYSLNKEMKQFSFLYALCDLCKSYKLKIQKQKIINIFFSTVDSQSPDNVKLILAIGFLEDDVIFDWNYFISNSDQADSYFIINYHSSEIKIFGKQQQLKYIHAFCSGKFFFKKYEVYQKLYESVLEQGKVKELHLQNIKNGRYYIERIFLLHNDEVGLSHQSLTNIGFGSVPEEIKIIQQLQINRCPYICQVDSLNYDGEYYSYIYEYDDSPTLRQILEEKGSLPLSFMVQILEQLLNMLVMFQDLCIVHNGLILDNIKYAQEMNQIMISNFSYAQSIPLITQRIKGNYIGSIPNEMFEKSKLTSQANVFQLGVVLYQMLFQCNPFGKTNEEQVQNNMKGNFQIPNIQIDKCMGKIVKSMLQKNPAKRMSPKEYLSFPLFKPSFKAKLSKHTLILLKQQKSQNKIQEDEYVVSSQEVGIQPIKSLQVQKMKK